MNYLKTADVFDTGVSKQTLILIPSEMGTRYNYVYTIENLAKHYRIVVMDIPGSGSLSEEKPTLTNILQAISTCVNNHCPDKKAVLLGLSMGGYFALRFANKFPTMVRGLILVDCMSEQFGASQVTYASEDIFYSFLPKRERSYIMRKKFADVSPERVIRAYMTTVMSFDRAFEYASIAMESEPGFYLKCISDFPGKILFIVGETGWRSAEAKFLNAAQDQQEYPDKSGSIYVAPKVGHDVLLHQDSFDRVHKEILDFLLQISRDKPVTI
jgi:pimeloyl-ACP methyl ester carboxylesterase